MSPTGLTAKIWKLVIARFFIWKIRVSCAQSGEKTNKMFF
jgi:hypothetical protein